VANKSGKHESKRRPQAKPRVTTIPYEDRPRPPSSRRVPFGSAPELITIDEVGRASMAAIEDALRAERLEAPPMRARGAVSAVPEPAFVYEISTFVIQGVEIFGKATNEARREFVARRLLHRLPVLTIDEVERIDMNPGAAADTVIVRVWTRVEPPIT
jgi:hypothetical protein